MTASPSTVFFVLFVVVVAWFGGHVSGRNYASELQLAAASGLAGCDANGVTCHFNPENPPAPATPGQGCTEPIPPQNAAGCATQKAIAEKQVTSGVNTPAPTFSKLEYTPSACTVTTSVGGGQCNPNASKTCPTAHNNGTTQCFWTSCPQSTCTGAEEEQQQPQLPQQPPPEEQPATSTSQGGEGKPPEMPQGGGGGGGGDEQPQQEDEQCVLFPDSPQCDEEDDADESNTDDEDEADDTSTDDDDSATDDADTSTSTDDNPTTASSTDYANNLVAQEQHNPADATTTTTLATATEEPSYTGSILRFFSGIGVAPRTAPATTNAPEHAQETDFIGDSNAPNIGVDVGDLVNALAVQTYNLVNSIQRFLGF